MDVTRFTSQKILASKTVEKCQNSDTWNLHTDLHNLST